MHFSTVFRTVLIMLVCFNASKAGPGSNKRQDELDISWPFDSRSFDMVSILSLLSSFLTKTSLAKLAATLTTAKLAAIGYALLIKLKPVMVVIGALYMVSMALGFIFPNSGIASTMRSLESSIMDQVTSNVNSYDPIEMAFDYMRVDKECRDKAACEVGVYVAKEYPFAARGMRLFSGQINHRYTEPVIRGARLLDCDDLYPSCKISPLQL